MAVELRLFERIESGKSLFAVERISLMYNALTSVLIFILYPEMAENARHSRTYDPF